MAHSPTSIQFELVSPEKLLISKAVAMVTIPGGEGDYGVLPDHAPMITTVKAGVIEVSTDNSETVTDRIFVSGGFAEVTPQRCTVLADEVIPVSELNKAKLEETAKALAEQIAAAAESDVAALQAQQTILVAKIQAAA